VHPAGSLFPASSLVAVPSGGAVVVVDADVVLTGKTGLVEVFACVLTNAFGGSAAWPELIASAFVLSVVGSCGPICRDPPERSGKLPRCFETI
jgi:hypothetical protein